MALVAGYLWHNDAPTEVFMKILHLTKKYPPVLGGDASVVYNLKKQQVRLGYNVHIATLNCGDIKDEDVFKFGIKEHVFNLDRITHRRILSLILLPFWGLKNIRELRPDVIHSHSADIGFFISIAAKIYGVPVINTCHGISFNDKQYSFPRRFIENFFLKYSNFRKIIAVDIKGLQALKDAGIRNAVCIPNGVDPNRFNYGKGRYHVKTTFLFVGRLEKQKGLIYLINAAKILKSKKDFDIILVGEGTESDNLNKIGQEFGIGDILKFKGKITEQALNEYYLECDVFVLPSIWEGMPLTLLEAAAAGMPIIASNIGGISSIFAHEENALIVEPKNAEALANAMRRLLDDKKLREKLGTNARSLAKKFSWEKTTNALNEIYMEAVRI